MHNIRTNFIKILEVIKDIIGDEINEKGNCLSRGSIPKLSDIAVIALLRQILYWLQVQDIGNGNRVNSF